jgi:hypothetical protein
VCAMILYISLGLLLNFSSAGNCVGRRCHRDARRIQGVPEEEINVLEYLGTITITTTTVEPLILESTRVQTEHLANPHTSPDGQDPALTEQHLERVVPLNRSNKAPQSELNISVGNSLPSHGFIFEFVSDGTTIRKKDTLDVVEMSRISTLGVSEKYTGRISLLSDCRANHSVDKLITVADALIPLRVSPSYLLTVGRTYVDYDHVYACHRTRRAIVWEPVTDFVSITELRRSSHNKRVPPQRAFEITRMILDMIHSMHKAGISHGNLTPSNVWVGEGRTMIMNLKGAAFSTDGMNRDMESAFQILIDMNPQIYMRYAIKPLNDKDAVYQKKVGELRSTLMVRGEIDVLVTRYTTATAIVDSIISLV